MPRDPVLRGSDPGDGPPELPEMPEAVETAETAEAGAAEGFDADDARLDDRLRPQCLDDVVGQSKVVERLRIVLEAARRRGDPLSHLLFDGPPGIGKTTLATVLPRELGVDVQITSGPSLSAPKDLLPYLTNASRGSVLFIDEIHRLPPTVEEFLYPAMEDFRIDITLGEGLNARTINMTLEPFTLIGATTRSGMLTAPLRDRFVNREHLDFYDVEDVTEILRRNARKLRTELHEGAAVAIASRSRGVPRKANNLLRWTRDFADAGGHPQITDALADEALRMLEVDILGLDSLDRKYLQILVTVFGGGPAGMQAIAHSMNIVPETIENEVEPFLLRVGFVQRTPRGRVITAAALAHLGLTLDEEPGEGQGQGQLFD